MYFLWHLRNSKHFFLKKNNNNKLAKAAAALLKMINTNFCLYIYIVLRY